MKPAPVFPLTVFYDASCPLCAGEMHALKAADPGGKFDLVDCSAPGFDSTPFSREGVSLADMMRLIHARDAQGGWLKGVEVFEAVYAAAGIDSLARLWRHPRLRPLWERLYPWVARNRQTLSRLGVPRLLRSLIAHQSPSAGGCVAGRCLPAADRSARPSTGIRS